MRMKIGHRGKDAHRDEIGHRTGGRSRRNFSKRTPAFDTLEYRQMLSTFTVTNTRDGGTGSLRQALQQAVSGSSIVVDPQLVNQGLGLFTPATPLLVPAGVNVEFNGATVDAPAAPASGDVFVIEAGVPAAETSINDAYVMGGQNCAATAFVVEAGAALSLNNSSVFNVGTGVDIQPGASAQLQGRVTIDYTSAAGIEVGGTLSAVNGWTWLCDDQGQGGLVVDRQSAVVNLKNGVFDTDVPAVSISGSASVTTMDGVLIEESSATGLGSGAVDVQAGDVTIENSEGWGSLVGPVIHDVAPKGTLALTNDYFFKNEAGVLSSRGVNLAIADTTIKENANDGPQIAIYNGEASLTNVFVGDNVDRGPIDAALSYFGRGPQSSLTIDRSTFYQDTSGVDSRGQAILGGACKADIDQNTKVVITNSTLTGVTPGLIITVSPGTVLLPTIPATLDHVTIANPESSGSSNVTAGLTLNSSGTLSAGTGLYLENSIVDQVTQNGPLTVAQSGPNLIGPNPGLGGLDISGGGGYATQAYYTTAPNSPAAGTGEGGSNLGGQVIVVGPAVPTGADTSGQNVQSANPANATAGGAQTPPAPLTSMARPLTFWFKGKPTEKKKVEEIHIAGSKHRGQRVTWVIRDLASRNAINHAGPIVPLTFTITHTVGLSFLTSSGDQSFVATTTTTLQTYVGLNYVARLFHELTVALL